MLTYALGWIAGRRFSKGGWDFLAWAASGLVYGALVGLGAYLFSLLAPYPVAPEKIKILLLSIIFGVPWVLMSQLAAEKFSSDWSAMKRTPIPTGNGSAAPPAGWRPAPSPGA